ncbi:MAG: hypothetical protein OEW77_06965 [Gemmatimonadota bacterium]|nr:hypothetical protein [Gemmatimonadota bacterium]
MSSHVKGSMFVALAVLVTVGAACSTKKEPPPPRTDAQKRAADSTLGASRIPGAAGVKNAMAVSDSAARRKATLDSMAANP